ncbi:Wd40/yvtn repeat-like-containing domain [Globisporangium polare]
MTQDSSLNRRGGGSVTARSKAPQRETVGTDKQTQQQEQQRALKQSVEQLQPQPSTQSDVAQGLKDAMPKLLMRFFLSTLLFALIAIGTAFYLPSGSADSRSLASGIRSSKAAAERLEPAVKFPQTLSQQPQKTGKPTVHVLAKYPHDSEAFTQGLLVAKQGNNKFFIESTGLFGKSTLRKVAIETGEVLGKYDLPSELFGEGVTLTKDSGELVMLTWKSRKGFVFQAGGGNEANGFTLEREFEFSTVTGEGWGIDSDGTHLIVSDGSANLLFWDPNTMTEVRRVEVTFQGHPIARLNELEVAKGFLYANIWYEKLIAKIDLASGDIVAVFDCNALADALTTGDDQGAVLNGIAYDGDEDVFYLTGKLWNAVYKVRLLE